MKLSFYQMLGIEPSADHAQIDAAYSRMAAKLNASASLRGTAEMVKELQLLREGHKILSDPALRAKYDAMLLAANTGVKLMFFPEDNASSGNLGVAVAFLVALTAVFAGVVYSQMEKKVEEVRVEHQQAVERRRQQQNRPIVVDAPREAPVITSAPEKTKAADKEPAR